MLDVHSGAIHVVDKLVYDLIETGVVQKDTPIPRDELFARSGCGASREEFDEACEEVEELINQGLLFSQDLYGDLVKTINKPVVKALCLHIAHACNLSCAYCFAGEGRYGNDNSLMSLEVGKKAVDFLIEHSGNRRNLEIDFFGGEPTLNFEVVKGIVDYGRQREKETNKNFRFTLTTNGLLLDEEMKAYVNKNMTNVVLSLDGRKEVNDIMRRTKNGKSCYDEILPRFLDMAESRNQTNYYVRGTFTRKNLDFSEDVTHLADLGFTQISVEPVVAPPQEDYALRDEDADILYKEYERLADQMLEYREQQKPFNFFHFNVDFTGGSCVSKRVRGCGAGSEYLAVTPEGDLYPCHQFVGNKDFRLGSVFEGYTLREEFLSCNIYTKNECKNCWAKMYCSGGCAANAYNQNGDINSPYELGCKLARKRIECAIYLYAKNTKEVNS